MLFIARIREKGLSPNTYVEPTLPSFKTGCGMFSVTKCFGSCMTRKPSKPLCDLGMGDLFMIDVAPQSLSSYFMFSVPGETVAADSRIRGPIPLAMPLVWEHREHWQICCVCAYETRHVQSTVASKGVSVQTHG